MATLGGLASFETLRASSYDRIAGVSETSKNR
jgi:hypothetical protein